MTKTFIIRDNRVKRNAMGYIAKLPMGQKDWQVEIKEFKNTRNNAQNRLLFLWLTYISKSVAENFGKFYNSTAWKEYFQDMFLGYDVNPINSKESLIKTSTLNTQQFTNFLNSIDHYVGSEFEMQLPHPHDLYTKAMGY